MRLAQLDRSIEADPDFAVAYVERAGIYIQELRTPSTAKKLLGREADLETLALDDIKTALKIEPNLGSAYAWLGMIHRYNWRRAEAKDAFERGLELSPNDPAVLTNYGYFLNNIRQHEEAIKLVERALTFDPRNPETHAALAQFRLAAGDYDQAASEFDVAAAGHAAWVLPLTAGLEIIRGKRSEAALHLLNSEMFTMRTESPQWPALTAYMYARLDLVDDTARLLARFDELAAEQQIPAAAEVVAHLARGHEEAALHRLVEAADEKTPYEAFNLLMSIATNVYRDPVLDKSEFAAARQKLRFADQ